MKHYLLRLAPAIAIAALAVTLQSCVHKRQEIEGLLVFTATGDGPRDERDWSLLEGYFGYERADGGSLFLLHLGDITKGTDVLPEQYYADVAELFQKSAVPVLFVPGDNEWNDLDNPHIGWRHWEKHFLHFEEHFEDSPILRRQKERPENIAWITRGVLMIGINLVGGRVHDPAEWRRRHAQDVEWVEDCFDRDGDTVRATIIFAQAKPQEKHEDFFEPFLSAVATFGKPVLYLHGDGHTWELEEEWRKPNLTRVQVDAVGKAPPVRILVTFDPDDPFHFDRRLAE